MMRPVKAGFAIVFLVVLILKLSTLNRPFWGYFASYQILSGMVAMSFVKQGFVNLLLPQALNLIHGAPAVDLLYYPLLSLLAAGAYHFLGLSIDFWGRFFSVIFSTLTIFFFYRFALRITKEKDTTLLAAFFYTIFPINIVMGQCFMNESMVLFCLLVSFTLLVEKGAVSMGRVVASGLLFSMVLALRIHYGVLLPIPVWLIYQSRSRDWWIKASIAVLIAVSLPLLWFYYVYITAPSVPGLHTSFFTQLGEGRRFVMTRDILRQFLHHFWGVLLNPVGFTLTLFGFFMSFRNRFMTVLRVWLLLCGVIVLVLPQKVADHPFYLMPLLVPAAVFCAVSFQSILEKTNQHFLTRLAVLFMPFLVSLRFVIGPLYASIPESKAARTAIQAIQHLVPPDALLVVSHPLGGGILYYSHHEGWILPLRDEDLHLIHRLHAIQNQRPAAYYVMADPQGLAQRTDFAHYLENQYVRVFSEKGIVIYKLQSDDHT